MIISSMLTENDSSQPAMRVKRRGEKSRAGLIAAPAFRPKLEIYKFVLYHFRLKMEKHKFFLYNFRPKLKIYKFILYQFKPN